MDFEFKIRNIKVAMYSAAYIHHIKVTVHNTPLLEEPHHWRLHSKGIILTVGHTYSPFAVLTLTNRTMLSSESKISVILPTDHIPRGKLSSFTITNAPFLIFAWFVCHLLLCCRVGKYSDNHLFQKCLVIVTTCFQFLRLDSLPSACWLTYFARSVESSQEKIVRSQSFKIFWTVTEMSQGAIAHDRLNFCKDCAQLQFC